MQSRFVKKKTKGKEAVMFWWRAIFTDGTKTCFVDGVLRHFTEDEAEDEARSIGDSIGIENYARAKGIDLSKWKLVGVYLITHTKQ